MKKANLVGKKFGRLLVIDGAENNKQNKSVWKCKCDCGKIILRSGAHLCKKINIPEHKSCGCLHRELSSKRATGNTFSRKPIGTSGFNCVYQKYKYTAKIYNRKFDLTKDEFRILTKGNCWYCGEPPSKIQYAYFTSAKWKPTRGALENSAYIYNGIDRIDNNKGYVLNNCATCCVVCNRAKMDMPINEFREWIIKISKKLGDLSVVVP